MRNEEDLHIEKDKIYAPFLLAASFNGLIKFISYQSQDNILYWLFTPSKTAQELLVRFGTKTEPHIPAKDLFEAIDTFWKQIAQEKKQKGDFK